MLKKIEIFIFFCFCFAQCHKFQNSFYNRFLQSTDVCINKSVKNIGYIGQGYNIIKGNPRSNTGLDPGYTNFQLISYDYPKEISQSYGKDFYSIKPKGIIYEQMSQCSTKQFSKMYNNLSEYVSQLAQSVSVASISNLPEFYNSETFQTVQQIMKKKSSFIVETQATCAIGTAEINTGSDKPRLSQALIDQLIVLENSMYSEQGFYDFFNKVGTHVAINVKFGSQFGYTMEISNQLLASYNQTNASIINAALSLANKVVSNNPNFTFDEKLLQDEILQWQSYQIGSHLPSDNDPFTWLNTTMNNPMPIQTKLITIDQFIARYNGEVEVKNMTMLITKVQQFLQSYCPTYLSKQQGNQITCQYQNEQAFSEISTVAITLSEIKKTPQKQAKVIIIDKDYGFAITFVDIQYSDGRKTTICTPMSRGFGVEETTLSNQELMLSYIADKDSWMIMRNNKCLCMNDNNTINSYSEIFLQPQNCDPNNQKQLFQLSSVNSVQNEVTISNYNARLNIKSLTDMPHEQYLPYMGMTFDYRYKKPQSRFILMRPT